MDIKSYLIDCFKRAPAAPFLFVGSGFSRRYLGLPDWKTLLQRFATKEKFGYYLSTASKDLAQVASLMAIDFHDEWWSSSEYAESRSVFGEFAVDKTSALRFEICKYVASLTEDPLKFVDGLTAEIEALRGLNVEGVITTNWDNLVELLYPEYKVFVGQDELLFSNPQSIGEIYKIHGGATRPESLILTSEDYADFQNKNPYLASKLITLFVEHPIVFIGYSLADKNIRSLLRAISDVLGQDKLDKLSENLIFIQRAHGKESSCAKGVLAWDDGSLPITIVSTDDYLPVYEALDAVKRKIPARILRYCKEQLYELIKSSDASNKMIVVDANTIDKKDDIEFVIGVGVAAERASAKGYRAINAYDLFDDLIFLRNGFDAACVLSDTVPVLARNSKFIPIFKYLKDLGVDSHKSYKASIYKLEAHLPLKAEHYKSKAYVSGFVRDAKGMTAAKIFESFPAVRAANYAACLSKKDFDASVVLKFLKDNIESLKSGTVNATAFRKLACAYDFHVNGWDIKKQKLDL